MMSLFPAYSQISQAKTEAAEGNEWLENNSFPTPLKKKEEEEVSKVKKHEKKKRKKKKKDRKRKKLLTVQVELKDRKINNKDATFFIDKERQAAYLSMDSLPKTMIPKYTPVRQGLFPMYMFQSKHKLKRYFKSFKLLQISQGGSLEDEAMASKKTEEFNKILGKHGNDVATWIKYVEFQDEFYKYQHIKYKSSIERERAAAQHKLSILDKAVTQNPDNKELQALWLKIGTNVLPSEEMSKRIDKILAESGGTMTLWLGLMTTTQYSLARCTVPSVSQLYEKLLLNFQNIKKYDLITRDKNVLELLFHYGRFLDNCGQWETLWMIIKVNLQFNTNIVLDFDIEVDEKVKKLEDEIVREEKRAVWQLWSKLERIREGLHFLPNSNSSDYPQRCVAPENVVHFTWHFSPVIHFQLVVSFIVLLKIPLLPSTHTILKVLTPNSLPWIFDSPEFILASLLSSPAVKLRHHYLSPIRELSRGPQYLRNLHGQEEFLDFISFTFKACLKAFEGRQKTALGVWWLRFERWINLLDELGLASLPKTRKTAKNIFKEFLENEENRENLLYYTEYCLLQYSQGKTKISINALKTLILSRPPVLTLKSKEEKEALIAVYRTYCEVLIGANQRREALNLLINLGNNAIIDAAVSIHSLVSAEKKFKQVATELLEELESEVECSMEDLLMPNFIIEWVSCYFWLIALTKTSVSLKNFSEDFFHLLDNKTGLIIEQIRECLCETILTITWTFERNNLLYVENIVQKCYTTYPQNLKILNFIADHAVENCRPWLTIRKTFLSTPSTTSCVFLICVALEKFNKDKENFQNRMKNLFQDLALQDGKLSTIIHCLRLRYLFEHDNSQLDVAQLQALESCPWNKSIYSESILLLPAKLMQLTDVLIEKELKIHITPDEIQEMRD